jgi:hypothetical protein
MAKLDKSKDFGIIGGIFGIARFEQDGNYFDASGELLDGEGNALAGGGKPAGGGKGGKGGKGGDKPAVDVVATTETDPQLAAQLGGE